MKPARIHVMRAGPLTTIQDLGRYGFRRFGMPTSGAMDTVACAVANVLVANSEDAAVLEVTAQGAELRFEGEALVAVTGADLSANLDGAAFTHWAAAYARDGSVLSFGPRKWGARAYVAVAGGIDVPRVLNSRSTHVRSETGGYGGRRLAKGDCIVCGRPTPAATRRLGRVFPEEARPPYGPSPTLRALPGPQVDAFAPQASEALVSSRYHLTSQSDRMGYRLTGPALVRATEGEMVSEATPVGALQVPADGQPILLMADCQTTGGYPKIAVVTSVDLPLAGQLLPGDSMSFSFTDVATAQRLYRQFWRTLVETLALL